jgi:hypothetical protein
MFAAHDVEVPVDFAIARERLARLAEAGGLHGASLHSYAGGVEHLLRAEPVPKLVRIRFLDPVYADGQMAVGLRWEATGVTGGLFPVLDADIILTSTGEQRTKLALVGSYRPPLGALGAGLDKAILNHVAAVTISALLRQVADTITRDGSDGGEDDSRDDDDEGADARRHRDP